jgi:hypothetical protein
MEMSNPTSMNPVAADAAQKAQKEPVESPDFASFSPVPLPSKASLPFISNSPSLTPLVCDERAISRLLEMILERGGLTAGEAARRLGTNSNNVRQYVAGRRTSPGLMWFLKLAEVAGARVFIEFPKRG